VRRNDMNEETMDLSELFNAAEYEVEETEIVIPIDEDYR
jgi:hypothetical protein